MTEIPLYLDNRQSPEQRTADLLPRMTLAEKVGQMMQLAISVQLEDKDEWVTRRGIGSFLHCPLAEVIRLQKLADQQTRLRIPLLFGEDAIHGHCLHPGATIFPTQLTLSCSWNPQQFRRMAQITATEMAATGMYWTFSPVLCMGRDWRWGRVNETCGEDPLLIGDLTLAMIAGYQGDDLAAPTAVLACAKHYAGYATSSGGRDAYESPISRRGLKTEFLPPFRRAAQAGCATFMAGYQANDGVPCSADKWLLREVLCDEWGFDGFTVTDWNNVGALVNGQKVCRDMREASKIAIEAGNHMIMSTAEFYDHAIALVGDGEIDAALIDDACRRILLAKFRLGLFDHKRYPAENKAAVIGCGAHVDEALNAARDSLVLLENQHAILPLASSVRRLALVGPNADDVYGQLGDWSFGSQQANLKTDGHNREQMSTLRSALARRQDLEVHYARGCDVLNPADQQIAAAVAAANAAEVVIACVGDNIKNHGEGSDRADLGLSGAQQQLLEAVKATGKPLIVVLMASKPLTVGWIKENADAVLAVFNPGMGGGEAIVEALFGQLNPHGKLTVSFPRHVGQQPVNYQQYPGWHTWGGSFGGYYDMSPEPLWAFGYGQSYSRYRYENLVVQNPQLGMGDSLQVSIEISNISDRDGIEIVQLYVNDCVSSVTTPVKQLKAYRRLALAAGERQTVSFTLPIRELTLVLPDLREVVEPGTFAVMVGPSSRDQDLLRQEFVVTARGFSNPPGDAND